LSEQQLYDFECNAIAFVTGALLLWFLMRWLRRNHPGLGIARAVGFAYLIRVLLALGLNQTPIARELRGGDELLFLSQGIGLSHDSIASSAILENLTKHFHVFFFSFDYRLFSAPPDMMLRIQVITFAVAGLALLAAAVYELAGPRPALVTAWVLALEPANVFFSGILHKEPFMMFAEGLVAYGGARLWKRGDLRAFAPMIVGCLIATATRPYVGWFLAAATAVMALHASVRRNSASTSVVLAFVMLGLIGVFIPTVWNASSKKNLSQLQISQTQNATDNSNLSLERVDYSTRDKVILNLPKRVVDIVTKPYPWQLANTSQRLGLLGTTFLFVGLVLLLAALIRNGRAVMRRAGPLVYPALFLLAAYALSAGNAGTAFRYRTHLVAFLVAVLAVLRKYQEQEQPDHVAPQPQRFEPLPTRAQPLARAQTT
jgi:hypothetical protein